MQLDLFKSLQKAYVQGPVSNDDLYEQLVADGVIDRSKLDEKQIVGSAGKEYKCLKRRVRWAQQTLKKRGLLESAGERGRWRLTEAGRRGLTPAQPRKVLVAFSTKLGLALWASCDDVFANLDAPISLCLTSPPYPLARPRAYGNPTEAEYVDWLCARLEPIVKHLMPGGSIVLNISNDIFLSKSPARSMYCERLLIALHERLGLWLMDRHVWNNPCRPPGPMQWASKERIHLNVAWEPVYWLTNDPSRVRANNQRVLEPHTEKHLKLMRSGGERSARSSGDGAHRVRVGAYGNETAGRIPKNVLTVRHNCASQDQYKAYCRSLGLPAHGASMPLALAKKYVEFLTEKDDLVVDLFGGGLTTGLAAEELGRYWVVTELMGEHVMGGAGRFHGADGFEDYMTPIAMEVQG